MAVEVCEGTKVHYYVDTVTYLSFTLFMIDDNEKYICI